MLREAYVAAVERDVSGITNIAFSREVDLRFAAENASTRLGADSLRRGETLAGNPRSWFLSPSSAAMLSTAVDNSGVLLSNRHSCTGILASLTIFANFASSLRKKAPNSS